MKTIIRKKREILVKQILVKDLDKNKSKAICLQNLKKHQETCPEKKKYELNNK